MLCCAVLCCAVLCCAEPSRAEPSRAVLSLLGSRGRCSRGGSRPPPAPEAATEAEPLSTPGRQRSRGAVQCWSCPLCWG